MNPVLEYIIMHGHKYAGDHEALMRAANAAAPKVARKVQRQSEKWQGSGKQKMKRVK